MRSFLRRGPRATSILWRCFRSGINIGIGYSVDTESDPQDRRQAVQSPRYTLNARNYRSIVIQRTIRYDQSIDDYCTISGENQINRIKRENSNSYNKKSGSAGRVETA